MILSPRRLSQICDALDHMEHVRVMRIHTRVPIVDPDRITDEVIAALRKPTPAYIVIHTNHPNEFTPASKAACARLADAGLPLLSQTVLLKGINDRVAVMTDLMRILVENRIKPYYLHHGYLARGTSHFPTSIADGQTIVKSLRGRASGLCQPTYVLDIPGGHGKVPIGPNYLRPAAGGGAEDWGVEDGRGRG